MVAKFIKLLIVIACIPLLSGCDVIVVSALSALAIASLQSEILDATYNENFIISVNNTSDYDTSVYKVKQNIEYLNKKYPQVQVSTTITKTFSTKLAYLSNQTWSKKYILKEPNYEANIEIFDKPQDIGDSILFGEVNSSGSGQYYLLKDAINYQWYRGYRKFTLQYDKIKNTNNTDILYKIDTSILIDLTNPKGGNVSASSVQNVNFHYKYNINVYDNKTNKVYFNKSLTYDDNESTTTNNIARYPYSDYIGIIIIKNRQVIEDEVFTDELYNSLNNALQNNNTH